MSIFVTGAGKKPNLINYVEYIESTGTQYVKLGFTPNQDTRVVIDFQSNQATGGYQIIGSRSTGSSRTYTFGTAGGNNAWLSGYNNGGVNSGVTEDTKRHTADKNKNLLYLDGELIASATYASFTTHGEMWMFRFNAADGDDNAYAKMKVFSCQIYDNGTLVRDFRPCYDPDGIACLYDEVTGTYFYNAGTGEFIAGGAV